MLFALERIGVAAAVTDDSKTIRQADKVIFPGVGEASSAMKYLKERKLDEVISGLQQPVLGVCLGMQLLCARSEENNTKCMGIIPVNVKRFCDAGLKIPQVGWNTIYDLSSGLFTGLAKNSYVYNVHSYYAENSEYSIAKCKYGIEYAAAIKKDNFYGVQFHAEKSAEAGEKILKNFLAI
jgi:glutamine amidotransferase